MLMIILFVLDDVSDVSDGKIQLAEE